MTRKQRHAEYVNCPIEATLDLIGGKWKGSILFELSQEKRRFNELRRLFPKLSQRQLTNQLRELEADGLVHRKVFPVVPPRVEYSLTDRGQSMTPVLDALIGWGVKNVLSSDDQLEWKRLLAAKT